MPTLHDLGVAEAAKAIRTGEMTAEALADALLGRAAANTNLNAFITLDADQVRAAAREADRRRASGASLGPLHGVPLALKDNIDTAELPTSGGTPGLKGQRPKRNAVIVEALLGAGAIVLGKCNLHELAYGITNNNAAFGPARNPYAPDRIPGASSGGTGDRGGGAACSRRDRVGHRRIGTHPGRAVRDCWPSPDHGAVVAGRHYSDFAHPRHRRADDTQRRRLRVARWRRDRRASRSRARFPERSARWRTASAFLGESRYRTRTNLREDAAATGRRGRRVG